MNAVRNRPGGLGLVSIFFLATITIASAVTTASDRYDPLAGKNPFPKASPTINGEFVHNIGRLQMNVTNWGFVGSMPKSNYPMGDAPSAQFPAGSGVEYLYAAGIWVGAIKGGVPCVSTGYPETEFRPGNEEDDTIYRTFEGDVGGFTWPGAADDDGDGLNNEDFLNGIDDDRDGRIDEDFAAIGKQMFTCEYTDDQPVSTLIWPEHDPLGVRIRHESYQWGDEGANSFIGMRYTVTNIGNEFLESMYVGIYADVDAGPRDRGSYHMDDQVGYWSGSKCAPEGSAEVPVNIKIAYVYDNDGDDGRTTGYFGIVLLGHTTGVNDFTVPRYPSHYLTAFKVFQGLQPFVNGGDATNDFERYEVMSSWIKDENTSKPGDYRILISSGPFYLLMPGRSIHVDIAYVAGEGLDELLDNAAVIQHIYNGIWYDMDGDPMTGIIGRESPVIGPLTDYDPDACDGKEEKIDVPKFDTIWSNLDCYIELFTYLDRSCYKPLGATLDNYKTGMDGKEYNLHWITGSAPTPPNVRAIASNHRVTLLWDNLSELTPDLATLEIDFEGYQIWRADDWHRPLGSSKDNGPSENLWSLLETRDLVNGVSPDISFKRSFESGGWIYTPLKGLPDRGKILRSFTEALSYNSNDTIPCPPGLAPEVCDTLEAIARHSLKLPGGRQYYKFVDDSAKNGLPYFYSVAPYDHSFVNGRPWKPGRFNSPSSNFIFVTPISESQTADEYDTDEIYVVPNPATKETMYGWELGPTNDDPSGLKIEFRNLPRCVSTIRIFTVSGDLVKVLTHDGNGGNGTVEWNLVSRNGQDVGSGVYLFGVEPSDGRYKSAIGKFVIIR